jgi:two-component system, NarL family, nitrate/nitrite response regulator NarL
MMRIVLCDHHVVFAESLGHLLAERGAEVIAVTNQFDDARLVLENKLVDICLLDVVFGEENVVDRLGELREASPTTDLVLLCGRVDHALVGAATAAGVRGIAEKRQPVVEILDLLARVHLGQTAIPAHPAAGPARVSTRSVPNDAQRLAAYLTAREREVLSALVRGDSTAKLARNLGIAAATARCHIQSVLTKMGAHSRLEVATTAVRSGMVSPESGEWLIRVG